MSSGSSHNIDVSPETMKELRIYRALKPYIGHCLSLNHDLNNPLAGVIGYTEFLLSESSGPLTEDQRGFLTKVLSCAERMRGIVENLCQEKLSAATGIDLKSVTEIYRNAAEPPRGC